MKHIEMYFKQKKEDEIFKQYLADSLYCISNSRECRMGKKYSEILHPVIIEEKKPEEIVSHVLDMLQS